MAAKIFDPGIAAAVPVEAGDRIHRARLEPLAEDVARRAPPALTAASVVPQHRLILVTCGSGFADLVR
jgi:hypothetical protein